MKVVVQGCGRIARLFHLPVLAAHAGVRVVAVADADAGNLREAAALVPDALTFDDWRQSLEVEADAVVICLPPALHAPAAVAAFQAGRAVYLEKPLALEAAEGARVVEAWRASGRVGVMGFNFRFHPRFAEARARLGEIAPLRSIQTRFTSMGGGLPGWKQTRAGGGGVLLDLGSHHVDLARFLLGREVVRVAALVRTHEAEDDNAVLLLEFDDGTLMESCLSLDSVHGQRWELLGGRGRMGIDLERPLRLEMQAASWEGVRWKRIRDRLAALAPRDLLLRPGWEPSFAASLDAFVGAVPSGSAPPEAATIADGLASLEVILACETAARSGRTVEVA